MYVYNDDDDDNSDLLLWRRSRIIDVKMIYPDPNTCNARLKLTLGTKSSGQSQADGIVIVCRHCERDQRLEFDIRLDGVNQPVRTVSLYTTTTTTTTTTATTTTGTTTTVIFAGALKYS